MTKFNRCPNPSCGRTLKESFFGGVFFPVFECTDCGRCYCQECGGPRCPACASKNRKEVGRVWAS